MVDMVASFQCCRPCFFEENPMDSYDLKISHTHTYIYIYLVFLIIIIVIVIIITLL